MRFDDALKLVGEFGLYQKRLYLILCIVAISNALFMMGHIFYLYTPDHRCKIPGLENDTWEIQSPEHAHLINITIPPSNLPLFEYDRCHVIDIRTSGNHSGTSEVKKCNEWVYDSSVFYVTFTSKHNLVCGDKWKTSMIQAVYFFGVLCGDLGFGMLADVIGRRTTFTLCAVILTGVSFGASFAPDVISLAILEFMSGAAMHAAFIIACILSIEFVGPSKRVFVGVPIHMFFATGIVVLSGFGYFFRNHQYVQIGTACTCIIYMFYWWIIPESARWLVTQGKYKEASDIVQNIGKVNKKPIEGEDTIFDEKTLELPKGAQLWHLFQHRVLCVRTLIIFFNWMIVSMMYYGVTMHARYLGGNFFLNFFIMAVVEYPANSSTIYFLERFGRKKTHCACMFVGGIACLLTIFTVLYGGAEWEPATITLAVIGKMGSAAAFGVIYTFSEELFPTVVRNGGLGASSSVARIGGMLAPYVAKSGEEIGGDFGKAFPLVVFGAVSILAGCLALVLPETLHRKLPETIEDAKIFGSEEHPLYETVEIDYKDKEEENGKLL
ncbi:organic cation transporter protein-like isoform X1 [Saccostrea echinata]|uniref:organic cation transporter protein-like isoform X1 n=1 Tax=Saccostrea echinata TaxID=191078 RepID=UPI002A835821|nr:organic cation transporter protein-like isoform X1 [Saccostrea echinata]